MLVVAALQFFNFEGAAHAASAIASVDGDTEHNSVAYQFTNKKDAEKDALSLCKAAAKKNGVVGKCKIIISSSLPGYIAIAYGDDGAGYATGATVQNAVDSAAATCTKIYKNCDTNNVKYWYDEPKETDAAIPNNTASCIPDRRNVQCRSSCTNGDCIVTYQNNCKVHVQVNPVFNSLTNQWEYPAPPC